MFWPEQKIAVAADLHLEKASHYARTGQFLPPHDSYETLHRLQETLAFSETKKLILLGDSFHDSNGYARLDAQTSDLFETLAQTYELIWIIGNHDRVFIPAATQAYDDIQIEDIWFRHEADPAAEIELSGHYHPKASVRIKGRRITKPCFMEDGRRMILPAFGSLTGGLDVKDPVFNQIFSGDINLHLLGQSGIFSLPIKKGG
jgi:DNA ligase-associated metallophosphoesterase